MTTKKLILQSVRAKCLDCMGGSKREVRLCPAYTCELHAYRFGRDPNPDSNTGFARKNAQAVDPLSTKAE